MERSGWRELRTKCPGGVGNNISVVVGVGVAVGVAVAVTAFIVVLGVATLHGLKRACIFASAFLFCISCSDIILAILGFLEIALGPFATLGLGFLAFATAAATAAATGVGLLILLGELILGDAVANIVAVDDAVAVAVASVLRSSELDFGGRVTMAMGMLYCIVL